VGILKLARSNWDRDCTFMSGRGMGGVPLEDKLFSCFYYSRYGFIVSMYIFIIPIIRDSRSVSGPSLTLARRLRFKTRDGPCKSLLTNEPMPRPPMIGAQ